MKNLNNLLLFGLTLLVGCSVGSSNWNDHIDADNRQKIKTLNSKIFDALAENNPTKRSVFCRIRKKEWF